MDFPLVSASHLSEVYDLTGNVVLLVLIVPRLVPLKYVSTALGAHKSVSSRGIVHVP